MYVFVYVRMYMYLCLYVFVFVYVCVCVRVRARSFSPALKQLGRGADTSVPLIAELKSEWTSENTSTPIVCFNGVFRDRFTLYVIMCMLYCFTSAVTLNNKVSEIETDDL